MKSIKLNKQNIPDLVEIEKQCFCHPWSEESFSDSFENENYIFFGIEINKKIVAYGGINIILNECYITNVAVLPEYRKKGLAFCITDTLIKCAEENNCDFITLEVRESNENAIKLYEKCGLKKVGERKNFYTEPRENALIMTKYTEKIK